MRGRAANGGRWWRGPKSGREPWGPRSTVRAPVRSPAPTVRRTPTLPRPGTLTRSPHTLSDGPRGDRCGDEEPISRGTRGGPGVSAAAADPPHAPLHCRTGEEARSSRPPRATPSPPDGSGPRGGGRGTGGAEPGHIRRRPRPRPPERGRAVGRAAPRGTGRAGRAGTGRGRGAGGPGRKERPRTPKNGRDPRASTDRRPSPRASLALLRPRARPATLSRGAPQRGPVRHLRKVPEGAPGYA